MPGGDGSNPFHGHALRNPSLRHEQAALLLAERYRLSGSLRELGSHQDQNLLVESPVGSFVLKISNPGFTHAGLTAQNAAMTHLRARDPGLRVPVPVPDVDGRLVGSVDVEGEPHDVRLLTFLPGTPLSDAGYLAPSVLRALGRLAARAAVALGDFEHPGLDRLIQWDCRHAHDVVEALGPHDPDPVRRDAVAELTARADAVVRGLGDALRVQVVHADVTDVNVVCSRNRAGQLVPDGLIDFGDISRTWLVSDVAVAAVSAVLHAPDAPLQTAAAVLCGYHEVLPLTDDEVAALWPMMVLRVALCGVSSEQQAQLEPDNTYAVASRAGDWQVWEAVAAVPFALAEAHLRGAVGRTALRPGSAVASAALPDVVPPVVAGLVDGAVPLDLSTTTDALSFGAWWDVDAVAELVDAATRLGTPVARHGEGRLTDTIPDHAAETATVHLGADVFAPPGTVVRSPVAGTAHVADTEANAVVVRTDPLDVVLIGVTCAVADGAAVVAGQPLGVVSDRHEGLPPHVHVQLVRVPGLEAPARCVPSLADAWLELCPDPGPLAGGVASAPRPDPAALLARRDAILPGQQEHYYAQPPRIERGWRHHVVDTDGRSYLDMVNNVAVLGHSHPAVEAAVARQLRLINTNSRFHYEAMVEFAERLVARLPDPLDTVFLVSTGSEANDAALRMVRAATGRRDLLALRSAYHGWTTATDEVTTFLADNPNALETRPPWVHTVESPNTYRGRFRGPDAGERYLDDVHRVLAELAERGLGPAGFICEPLYGNAGGIPLPDGYLPGVYDAVRAAGGLCIADEVQVGYGRLGRWFWAFEQQGVVPDVVTVAKATGNGYPVAAVVTSRALADAFASEGAFFSSVGGAPAASAAALAVLDTLDAEDLVGNAERVGTHLAERLRTLADRYPLVGAVHGMGLYLGVELVRDRDTLEPATEETHAICERMLELGVIVQPTAEHHNVLKVKPPLCLTESSADFFVDCLERVLAEGW